MKKILLLAWLVTTTTLLFSEGRREGDVSITVKLSAQEEETARAMADLNALENICFKYLSQQERLEADRLLNETRGIILRSGQTTASRRNDESRRDDNGYRGVPDTKDAPPVLSDSSFQELLNSIKDEFPDRSKTKLVLTIGKNGRLTCAQLEKIVAVYSFDSDREELVRSIADKIVDPVNIHIVLRHFDSSFTKDKLAEFFQNR